MSTASMREVESPTDRAFSGHPRGLSTLFFTEMWERFSYGMRALLILFMTAAPAAGGLRFDTAVAGAVYGLAPRWWPW
jgi:POT family proton-dependent oligopeptide transporter